MRKLPKKVTELQDWLDMALDEFQRIHSCPGADEEIKQLCERGQRHIRQRVPLIHQCAELSTQLLAAKIALRESEAARGEDKAILDWLEKNALDFEFHFMLNGSVTKNFASGVVIRAVIAAARDAARAQEAKP